LQTSNRDIFAELSLLDVCKPTRLHHFTPFSMARGYAYTLVEFYLYPTVGTVLVHSVKPELTE